jgi:hypothetical protein
MGKKQANNSTTSQEILPKPIIFNFVKNKNPCGFFLLNGALNQNRTGDLILTMDALYLLSYEGIWLRG